MAQSPANSTALPAYWSAKPRPQPVRWCHGAAGHLDRFRHRAQALVMTTEEAPAMRQWHSADGWHIDVRGSPPPQPLVAILRLVRSLRDDTPVIVHHDRDPVMLYPELAQIGWEAERIESGEGEFRLLLRRVP
jgi:hypothetical protein